MNEHFWTPWLVREFDFEESARMENVSRLDLVRAGKGDILDVKDDAAVREQIVDLILQLQRLKGTERSPRDRHIQICLTELEGTLARFVTYVEDQP